jgi:hypothetical protein
MTRPGLLRRLDPRIETPDGNAREGCAGREGRVPVSPAPGVGRRRGDARKLLVMRVANARNSISRKKGKSFGRAV